MSITRFVTGAALVAALAAPVAASAQSEAPAGQPPAVAGEHGAMHRHHGHGRHHNPYLRALHSLGLSDAQKQQIRTAVRQTREADRLAMRANAEKLRGSIDGILTPEQRTQLRAKLAQERARHHRAPVAP